MLSFSNAVGQYNHTDSEMLEDAVDTCGKSVWRPTRQRQKWTDTVASQCGDQRDRDRSGLTLWQVSVETNATETEVD